MTAAIVHDGTAIEDTPAYLIGRLCAISASGAVSPIASQGRLVTQADITGTTLTLKSFTDTGALIHETTVLKTASVFDTLQTAETWEKLSGGGNLRVLCPAECFPNGGVTVRVEVIATLTDGSPAPGLWDIRVIAIYQS